MSETNQIQTKHQVRDIEPICLLNVCECIPCDMYAKFWDCTVDGTLTPH